MDFSKLDGYEFEDYIAKLLKSKGFKVEQTSYSGDGGIDLIATYENPIFSGKYIIQCKNYTGLVGQPEVRDLYGVVMSESANKGILITPSDFTQQAYNFAKHKNIELINGNILKSIDTNTPNLENETKSFIEMEGFNKVRFLYLENKILDNPTNESFYKEEYLFLRNYIFSFSFEICKAGLMDKIKQHIQKWKHKCYKNKNKEKQRIYCDILLAEIFLINGQVAEALEILITINCYFFNPYETFGIYRLDGFGKLRHNEVDRAITKNLYMILKFIGQQKALKIMTSKLQLKESEDYVNHTSFYEDKLINHITPESREIMEILFDDYNKFKNGKYDGKYIAYKLTLHGQGKYFYYLYELDDPPFLDFSIIKRNFYTKKDEELCKEVDLVLIQHGLI